jgi:hypothetical protein
MYLENKSRRPNARKKLERQRQLIKKRFKEAQKIVPFLSETTFSGWAKSVQEQILTSTRMPKPEVFIGPSAMNLPDAVKIKKEIEDSFKSNVLNFADTSLSLTDFFCVLYGVHNALCDYRAKTEDFHNLVVEAGNWTSAIIHKLLPDVYAVLFNCLFSTTALYSRLDNRIFWFNLKIRTDDENHRAIAIEIGSDIPPAKAINLKGSNTNVYRVGWSNGLGEIIYADMDGSLLNSSGQLPIYAHRHVLHRLKERLADLEELSPNITCYYMFQSLKKPVLGVVKDGMFLFEYRFAGYKIGYLGVELIDGVAVVKTFYFLTMRGMPERIKLAEKLQISGDELEWHGLDDLSGFIKTDLFDDPIIAEFLRECGCGDIETIRSYFRLGGDDPKKVASHLKRYLNFETSGAFPQVSL